MMLQMAYNLSRLLGLKAACRRSFSSLNNTRPCIPHSNWSTIFQSVFRKPNGNICYAKSSLRGIQSLCVRNRCGIGNRVTRPLCHPHPQNWPSFPSRCTSEVCEREFDTLKDEDTVNCQKGQEKLKDFLQLAESRGMRVGPEELKKVLDDVLAAVYSNGKYPFSYKYLLFKDQSLTGKIGAAGETGIFELFREQHLLKDLATCPEIEPLLSLIDENLPAMTASDKAHIYFCLNYLGIHGVHTNHTVMYKLFYVITERPGKLNFEDLSKFRVVLETLSNPLVVRNQLLLPHYKYLNSVGVMKGLEKQQLVRALSISPGLYDLIYHTANIPLNFSLMWHALVTDEEIMKHPENIGIIFEHFCYHYFSHAKESPDILKNHIFCKIKGAILQHIGNMDMKSIGLLCMDNSNKDKVISRSPELFSALVDRLLKILHNKTEMDTVEMLSVMNFYRFPGFQLPEDALAIFTQHMERNYPQLKLVYSISFLKRLSAMIRTHKKDAQLHHFEGLMVLMNIDHDDHMFAGTFPLNKLLMNWKLFGLTDEAFVTYMQQNLLFKKGFGRRRRWLPLSLQVMEEKLEDVDLKLHLKERILSLCEVQQDVQSLLSICMHIHLTIPFRIDFHVKHDLAIFFREILGLVNQKLVDVDDLKEVPHCISSLNFLRQQNPCVSQVMDMLESMMNKTMALILLPHQRADIVSLAHTINHHFYRKSNDFFSLTTPVMDKIVTNILDEEQTCSIDDFVFLTNIIASGVMSKSKQQQLEQFAETFFEENMDFMDHDSLLLSLDNLCLAGVFPPRTLTAVMSPDFLNTMDQCISEKSYRVVSREIVEYHLLRLNRTAVFECPALNIPWFCGNFQVVYGKPEQKCLDRYRKKTEEVLLDILGGEEFLSVNSLTRFKYLVDFQCFISPQGSPVPLYKINVDRPVPAGTKKVAIDILMASIWNSEPGALNREMKRHLKKEGYKYIQVSEDQFHGLALSNDDQLREYFIQEIFS